MNQKLEQYLYTDSDAYYVNLSGQIRCQSVHGGSVRYRKARQQADSKIVGREVIIRYATEFLNKIGITTTDDPIVAPCDVDYSKLQKDYHLSDPNDLVWMKFSTEGDLGVVATAADINFDYPKSSADYHKRDEHGWVHNTSGILMHMLGKKWDESFVMIFPLCGIPSGYKRHDIEKAVGNYLISKGVPVLDYYSHLY
jgi:hypothetical protein